MKLLFDPVLTNSPLHCSTNIQFIQIAERLLAEHDDLFIYWRRPDWLTEEERAQYPQSERILYLEVPQFKSDRVREYYRYDRSLEDQTDFFGRFWDVDVLVTVRSQLVPLMKMHMTSPKGNNHQTKEVWLIDEMPSLISKQTVVLTDKEVHEAQTCMGYAAADHVWVISYHEAAQIVNACRKHLSPSLTKAVREKVEPCLPVKFQTFKLKDPTFFVSYAEKPFCIAYSGRMNKDAGIVQINEMMLRQKIMKGEKVRVLVSTVSKVNLAFNEDMIELLSPSREEFWRMFHDDVHVFMNLSTEMGISMSILEPLMMGTPVILPRTDYAEGMLGKNYPFLAEGDKHAFGLLEMFYKNYVSAYSMFMAWFKAEFVPMYEQRLKTDLLVDRVSRAVHQYRDRLQRLYKDWQPKPDSIPSLLMQNKQGRFVLDEGVAKLVSEGKVTTPKGAWTYDQSLGDRTLPYLPNRSEYRHKLQVHYGLKDASTTAGELE